MAIKLARIKIQNFKPFEDYSVDFSSSNLVVFDGPNGFGKTSLYDAIELLLTGRLRRYSDLVDKVVDKRQASIGSPLLYDGAVGDLVIKAELVVDGVPVCLLWKGVRTELLLASYADSPGLTLYKGERFDNDDYVRVEDEEGFLTGLLGEDYATNFEFLNYIEQEENIHLLKKKDRQRKDAIAHLFNTFEFDQRINKLKDASKVIGTLCGKETKDSLAREKEYLDEARRKFAGEHASIPYVNIVSWKTIGWDAEKPKFSDAQYVAWLGDNGELDRVDNFLSNIDDFKKNKNNTELDNLMADERLVSEYIVFWNYIDRASEYQKRLALVDAIKKLLFTYENGVISAISDNKVQLTTEIQEIVKSSVDVNGYAALVSEVRNAHKNAGLLSQLLVGVRESRQSFIDKYMKYGEVVEPDGSCPLCGYSWQDSTIMKQQFDVQTEQLESLIRSSGDEVNVKLKRFVREYIIPIRNILNEYLSKNPVDKLFVRGLISAVNNLTELHRLDKLFEKFDIDLTAVVNQRPSVPEVINLDRVRAIVGEKKSPFSPENLQTYFSAVFLHVFNENYEYVAGFDRSSIAIKRKYLEWQYSLEQSATIKRLIIQREKHMQRFDDASYVKRKIDALKKIYGESLRLYQRSIIENIEILFHIYSGRISQEGKGGLGLFISSDKNGIRFLENHSKIHDAVFSMSSGQLATLVISFTLALNKRYSKNKIIFIDDPIQTLDELNIAGLVELLKNEFSDRQIFISTHEDVMSSYMRYKFKKHGLETQRLNFKKSQLSLN